MVAVKVPTLVTGGMVTKGTVTKAWDLAVRAGRGEGAHLGNWGHDN